MTLLKPSLFLRRLVIMYRGVRAYDETFHLGVNIIRGVNSTGKSTISDFIFFILGGDFSQWKPEAERCDTVFGEFQINDNTVTLRRTVSAERSQPLEIFWGSYEKAAASTLDGWERFPYARTGTKESFSQVLFRALDFPEVTGSKDSNITMHQILRLISVDQLSRVHSLMRDESFDSPLTRKTVGDVLMGIYDDNLYSDQLELRDRKSKLATYEAQHSSLILALSDTKVPSSLEALDKKRSEIEKSLNSISLSITELSAAAAAAVSLKDHSDVNKEIISELRSKQNSYNVILKHIEELKFNYGDSESFIKSLHSKLTYLADSELTESALGHMLLQMCPECLQTVPQKPDKHHCGLCGQDVVSEGRIERLARIKHELNSQLQESQRCQVDRLKEIAEEDINLQNIGLEIRNLQATIDLNAQIVRSTRDSQIDSLFQKKGSFEQELHLLSFQRQLVQKITDSAAQIKMLKSQISNLEFRIRDGLSRQDGRRIEAMNSINEITKFFLHHDLGREAAFDVANEVTVDFERNISEVDGRVNFSASSITYLRSAVNFAIFFASLKLPFFRYPRFIVNDNIEDKGMEEARSQNFQRLIVKLSKESAIAHQIIFTTSMIAPELDNEEFCIGSKYSPARKSLDFKGPPV